MMQVHNMMGSLIIETDKDFNTMQRDWIESLYEGSEPGKELTKAIKCQFMILLGEFLSEELYRMADDVKGNLKKKEAYKSIADNAGSYFDKPMIEAIYCNEYGLRFDVTEKTYDNLINAIASVLEYFPDPENVLNNFYEQYNLAFV